MPRHVRDDVAVEGDDADAVALALGEVAEARPDETAVLELADPAATEAHRLRHVEQDAEVRVGVRLILLDVVAIGAGVQPPVDAPDVIAGDVAAVLGEVDRGAEERRAMQAVDEAFDDVARHQLEVANPREDLRIHESRARNRFA